MSNLGLIQCAYLTDRGQVRDHNEDFVIVHEPQDAQDESKNGWLYVVADGVGGADAGEVASNYASERTIHHFLHSSEKSLKERLKSAMESAHFDLCKLIDSRQDDRRMGTTMVAAAVQDQKAVFANVGDSRAYLVRDGEITQITRDHSLVAKLLEEWVITREEAGTLNIGNIILQSIGAEQTPHVELYDHSIVDGDILVLCSDGLTNHVVDQEIANVVSVREPSKSVGRLVDLANDRGGFDNITVLVMRYGTGSTSLNGTPAE